MSPNLSIDQSVIDSTAEAKQDAPVQEPVIELNTLTTLGYLDRNTANKAFYLGVAKPISIKSKNIFQLKKLLKKHPAMGFAINKELEDRLSHGKINS